MTGQLLLLLVVPVLGLMLCWLLLLLPVVVAYCGLVVGHQLLLLLQLRELMQCSLPMRLLCGLCKESQLLLLLVKPAHESMQCLLPITMLSGLCMQSQLLLLLLVPVQELMQCWLLLLGAAAPLQRKHGLLARTLLEVLLIATTTSTTTNSSKSTT
jgi:hypothetical protein